MLVRADSAGAPVRRSDAATGAAWSSRTDRGQLMAPHVRQDGVMLVEGYAIRECVLDYVSPDGSVFRELVPMSTIRDSAAAIAHLPVTLGHPEGGVSDENVTTLGVGNVDSEVVIEDGGYTRVRIAVRSKDAKSAVLTGTHELSLGYDALVEQTPGEHPEFGRYDAIQVGRRMNHLAIVDQGRAGPECGIRVDGWSRTRTEHRVDDPTSTARAATGARMDSELVRALALLGLTGRYDSDAAALSAVSAELLRRKDAEEEAAVAAAEEEEEEVSALDAMTAERDALKAQLDALLATQAADAEKDAKADAILTATTLGLTVDDKAKSAEIRKAIATHFDKDLRADATDADIDAVVRLAKRSLGEAPGSGREAGIKAWQQTADSNTGGTRTARPTRRPWGRSPSATNKEA